MQTKKVRDIAPPRPAKKQEPAESIAPSPSAQRSSRRASKRMLSFVFFVLLIGGIAGVFSLQFFFAKAQVSVWPRTHEVTAREHLTARVGAERTDAEQGSIHAVLMSEEKSLTRLFPATGTSTEQGRAKGTIRVFNGFSTFPQKLVAQTRFLSEEGKLFRSLGAMVVPAGRMEEGKLVAGSLDIEVVAAESGEEYNIGPSNFSLPGLFGNPAYTTITGKSFDPMAGGSKTEVSVVTESDLNAARDALVAELQEEAQNALEATVPEGMVLLAQTLDLQVLQAFSPIKAGAPLDSFNFSAKVQGTATVFSRADVENAAQAFLAQSAQEGEALALKTLNIEYTNVEMNTSSQSISFDVNTSALVYQEIDPIELKARLAGASKEEAVLSLSQNSALEKAEIILFPFWLQSLPQDPNAVEVIIMGVD